MGILDDLLTGAMRGAAGGGSAQPANARSSAGIPNAALLALVPVVLSMLSRRGQGAGGNAASALGGVGGMGGGLGGLLQQLEQAGLGDQARSWVGRGSNLPISPDMIGKLLGAGGLASIASQAGVSEQDASVGLSQLMPDLIDRLTPDGTVPDDDRLSKGITQLLGQLAR
jgi:uncharacterized protein YidB (DUF937 family)